MMLTSETVGAEFTRTYRRAADFVLLMKPGILTMVLLTTFVGFYLGLRSTPDYATLLHVLVGTALAAGGTLALNQFLERDTDARMVRTRLRPLPAGRCSLWKRSCSECRSQSRACCIWPFGSIL